MKFRIAGWLTLALLASAPAFGNDISASTWSELGASNTAAPPNGWPTGVTPTQVSPMMRETMGAIKRWYNRANATKTSGGSANVQTLTYTQPTTAYVAGDGYTFIAGFTNTGAVTLNVDGLGAKAIMNGSLALSGGEIIAGRVMSVFYDGTYFQLPSSGAVSGGVLYATNYGVRADGVTSDDVAIKNAVDACAAGSGRKLILPPGSILLTGAAQISLRRCHMEGAGVGPSKGTTVTGGTTFLLTSTTVAPFLFTDGGIGLTGINFYWPNQTTGTTVYPALFTGTGSIGVSEVYWDKINILNAYNGFVTDPGFGGMGRWYITNSNLYAVHDLFQLGTMGDYIFFDKVAFNQGSWQSVDAAESWWITALDNAAANNTIFRFVPGVGVSGINISNSSAFAWRNGLVLDAGSQVGFTNINWSVDGVATVVDSTAAGAVLHSIMMTCNTCATGEVDFSTGAGTLGNHTAFKLGDTGKLFLQNSFYNTAAGTFVETAGATVFLTNNNVAFGHANDGGDYYFVNSTAGTSNIYARDNLIAGVLASTKHHGIYAANALSGLLVQNNHFIYLNESMIVILGGGNYVFTGNIVEDTAGTHSITASTTGGGLVYSGNKLDKPPAPTVSSCGAGATLGSNSTITGGFVQVGSTNPTTSCVLTFAYSTGAAAGCIFQTPAGLVVGGSPAGTPPVWTISSSVSLHGTQIYYSCPADR